MPVVISFLYSIQRLGGLSGWFSRAANSEIGEPEQRVFATEQRIIERIAVPFRVLTGAQYAMRLRQFSRRSGRRHHR
jgi:hypothetical protein